MFTSYIRGLNDIVFSTSDNPEDQPSTGVLGRIGSWLSPWRGRSPRSPTENAYPGDDVTKSGEQKEESDYVRSRTGDQQCDEGGPSSLSVCREFFPREEGDATQSTHRGSAVVSSTKTGKGGPKEEELGRREKGREQSEQGGDIGSESGNLEKNASHLTHLATVSKQGLVWDSDQENNLPQASRQAPTKTGRKLHVYLEETRVIHRGPNAEVGQDIFRTPLTTNLQVLPKAKPSLEFHFIDTSKATTVKATTAGSESDYNSADSQIESESDKDQTHQGSMGRKNTGKRRSRKNSQGDGRASPLAKRPEHLQPGPDRIPTTDDSGTSLGNKSNINTVSADSSSLLNASPLASPGGGESVTSCTDAVKRLDNFQDSNSVSAAASACAVGEGANMEEDDDLYRVERRTETPESKRRSMKVSRSEVKLFTKCVPLKPKDKVEERAPDFTAVSKKNQDDAKDNFKTASDDRAYVPKTPNDESKVNRRLADKICIFEKQRPEPSPKRVFRVPRSADVSPVRKPSENLRGNIVFSEQRSRSAERPGGARSGSPSPVREKPMTIKERARKFTEASASGAKHTLPQKPAMTGMPQQSSSSVKDAASKSPELDSQGKLDTKDWIQSKAVSDFTLKAGGEHTTNVKADDSTSTAKQADSKTKETVGSQTGHKETKQQLQPRSEDQGNSAEIEQSVKIPTRMGSRSRRRRTKEPSSQLSLSSESNLKFDEEESVDREVSASGQTAQKGSAWNRNQKSSSHKQPLGDAEAGVYDSEVPDTHMKYLKTEGFRQRPVLSDEPDTGTLSARQPTDKAPVILPREEEKQAEDQSLKPYKPSESDQHLSTQSESEGQAGVPVNKDHESKETNQMNRTDKATFERPESVGGEKTSRRRETKRDETTEFPSSKEMKAEQKVVQGGRGESEGQGIICEKKMAERSEETQPVNDRPKANQAEPQRTSESSDLPVQKEHISPAADTHPARAGARPAIDTNEAEKGRGGRETHSEVNLTTNTSPELRAKPAESSGTERAASRGKQQPNSPRVEKMENSLDDSCAHGGNDTEHSRAKAVNSETKAPETGTAGVADEKAEPAQKGKTEPTIKEPPALTERTHTQRKGFAINSHPSEVEPPGDKMKVAPVEAQHKVTNSTESKADQNVLRETKSRSGGLVSTSAVQRNSPQTTSNVTGSERSPSLSRLQKLKNDPVWDKSGQTFKADKLSEGSKQPLPKRKLQMPPGLGKVDSSSWQDGPSSWLDVDFPKQKVKVPEQKLTSSGSESNLLDNSIDDDLDFIERIKNLCAPFSLPPRKHNQLRPPQPPFAMPAIREDRFEKVFDPEEFTIGLRKKSKFTLENSQSLLSKHHLTETKPAPKPARASLADRCMLVSSLDTHSRLKDKTAVKEDVDAKEDAEDQLRMKSRLEGSCVLNSLVASNLRGKRNGVETQAEINNSSSFSPSEPFELTPPPFPPPPPPGPTASAPIKAALFTKKEEEAQAAQAVVCDSSPRLPSFKDTKLPDYLEKYLPQDQAKPRQSVCGPERVKSELNGKMTTPAAKSNPDAAMKPSLTLPDDAAPCLPATLPASLPTHPQLQQPPAQPRAKPRNNVSAVKRGVHKRPGKMVLFEKPQFSGQAYEIYRDLADATSLQLSPLVSVKVVRGCWILYEKPNFEGRTIALEEGVIELSNEWAEPEPGKDPESIPPMQIGSIRFAVGDYSLPHIDLFSEPEGRGRVTPYNYDVIETGSFGIPLSTASIQVHSGVWLVWSDPGYQGMISVLEKGEYPFPESWGFTSPFVGSLRPLKMGGFKVENPNEVKAVAYEKPGFEGCSLEMDGDVFSLCEDDGHQADPDACTLKSVGSLRIIGGFWVGYSQPGFEGQQHILEEGEYLDCNDWGGSELRSLRPILSDFMTPHVKMFSDVNFGKLGADIELTVPVLNMDDTGYGLKTQSVDVIGGVWAVFEEPGFCGEPYVLEKGLYGCPEDWGAQACRVGSTMPVLLDEFENTAKFKVQLFSDPGLQGSSVVLEDGVGCLKDEGLAVASCKVVAGSWLAFEGQDFSGKMYVLEEGSYADLRAMGCVSPSASILSLQPVGFEFSLPSITLFERSGLRGKRVVLTDGSVNLRFAEGCARVQSVLVEGGVWVLYEGINYRGAQILLRPGEVPDWHRVSSWHRVGSLRPLTQKQAHFRLRNRQTGMIMSVTGDLDDVKLLRIQETEETGGLEQIWFYYHGHLHCKLLEEFCLAPVGSVTMAGSRVGLIPDPANQTPLWSITPAGLIRYMQSPDLILEIKGGNNYDKNQVILNTVDPDRLQQRWDVEVL